MQNIRLWHCKYAVLVLMSLASSVVASMAPARAQNSPADLTTTAPGASFDMSKYVMHAVNGGRGGLPEVRMWLRQSQVDDMNGGRGSGWNYREGKQDNMHYSSWIFWQCGVSDALLQLIS